MLAVAGLVWASIASKHARDDRARLKAAMRRLADEVNAADLAELQGLVGEPGQRMRPDTLSSPEDIVARVVELARPPDQRSKPSVGKGRRPTIRTDPEEGNQQGPSAPASP
jgi:hypothetical protein